MWRRLMSLFRRKQQAHAEPARASSRDAEIDDLTREYIREIARVRRMGYDVEVAARRLRLPKQDRRREPH